jgi:predicted enzyme related to lactoylglutathione lyase
MPVELGYFTLPVKNLARAKAFYGALFGWEIEEGGHVANTTFPLGLSQNGPAEVPNAYFRVDDIEAAAAHATQLGGSVRARNQYPSGLNAVCADPDGTVFSLWQPAPGYE